MATNDTTTTNNNNAAESRRLTLTYYPAFCFRASPTNFIWVKIGAIDVHRLARRIEFGEQGLFFYQNHPIRFVNLIGIIIARVDVPRRTILTLDDSTGATIDIVVLKADPVTTSTSVTVPVPKESKDGNDDGDDNAPQKESHVTSTTRTPIDIAPLQPGKLFQIKGTLSVFRWRMQVQLERFFDVPDTMAEMRFVEARRRFFVDVLSVPWVVGEGDIEGLRVEADEEGAKIEEEQASIRRRGRRRAEREERERRKIEKGWEREEALREREARIAREVGREYMRGIERRRGEQLTV